MRKMTVYDFDINPYQPKEAYAGIYFTKNNKPCDHNGNMISMFSADIIIHHPDKPSKPERIPFKTHRTAFIDYLKTEVIPLLNKAFGPSIYKAIDEIVDKNNAPEPYIAIVREDKEDLSKGDMHEIKRYLKSLFHFPKSQTTMAFFNQNERQSQETVAAQVSLNKKSRYRG